LQRFPESVKQLTLSEEMQYEAGARLIPSQVEQLYPFSRSHLER